MIRPNILLFLTDDHGPWTLPAYGNRSLPTPHFDQLAQNGACFERAYAPCPVCSPARACVITGRTPSQTGLHDWLEEAAPDIANRDWLASEITLPELLQEAGYATALSGKWHLGRSHQLPRGFEQCFGLPGWQGLHNGVHTFHRDGSPVTLDVNKSQAITDHAIGFLDAFPSDRPFFLNIGYVATHSPYETGAHTAEAVAAVANVSLEDIPPYRPHPWRKNEGMDPLQELEPGSIESRCRGYYAAVHELDQNLGRVLRHLKEKGRRESTVVIYVSDHGCAIGHHGFWGKGNSTRPLNMYEKSLHVPLLMRGPGIPGGLRVSNFVDHYDLFQAVCELAGVRDRLDPARRYPGRSLVPLARGEKVCDWDDTRHGEYGDLLMIRDATWKLVHRLPNGPHDLFNLVLDPEETRNLAGLPEIAPVQEQLTRQALDWQQRHLEPAKSGTRVKELPRHNLANEAWRDGRREARGLQLY